MDHCPHQIAQIAAPLEGMAPFFVPAEAIHQIIAGIFNVTGDGRHDLQELIEAAEGQAWSLVGGVILDVQAD
jgi:hypothetical protein